MMNAESCCNKKNASPERRAPGNTSRTVISRSVSIRKAATNKPTSSAAATTKPATWPTAPRLTPVEEPVINPEISVVSTSPTPIVASTETVGPFDSLVGATAVIGAVVGAVLRRLGKVAEARMLSLERLRGSEVLRDAGT